MLQDLLNKLIDFYRSKAKTPLEILEDLYRPYYPRIIHSAQTQDAPGQEPHLKYGEIYTESFAEALQLCNPLATDRFCDLGSGSGKAVLSALLSTPITAAVGYEINPELVSVAELVAKKAMLELPELAHKHAEFVCADFLLLESLSEFNIVYVTATCFWGDHWERLNKLLTTLPANARVLITSRELVADGFVKIIDTQLAMSWGVASLWGYLKKS